MIRRPPRSTLFPYRRSSDLRSSGEHLPAKKIDREGERQQPEPPPQEQAGFIAIPGKQREQQDREGRIHKKRLHPGRDLVREESPLRRKVVELRQAAIEEEAPPRVEGGEVLPQGLGERQAGTESHPLSPQKKHSRPQDEDGWIGLDSSGRQPAGRAPHQPGVKGAQARTIKTRGRNSRHANPWP